MGFLDNTGATYFWGKIKAAFAEKSSVPTTVAELTDEASYAKKTDLPGNLSDLTNDTGFLNATQVNDAIDAKATTLMDYKGSVANFAALPTTGNKVGDTYNLQDTGENYSWDGTQWDCLGPTSVSVTPISNSEIDAICV